MKKKIFQYLVSIFVLLSISFGTSHAWTGLFANVWDVLSNTKWNEMITELNTKIDQSNVVAGTWITVTPTGSWVTISATGISGDIIPYISTTSGFSMAPSSTTTLSLEGINFTPTSTVSIPSWAGSINSTTINSPSSLDINITSWATETLYDIIVSNGGLSNTLWTGNGTDMINVVTSTWRDLRLWGDTFTAGNGAGNDIRYRAGMSLSRDTNGMSFAGSSPWSSWVKFESLGWTRWTNKTIDWIFTTPTSNMMIGIGSDATGETATDQYRQAEIEMYFSNSTTMWWLYWNNGTIGTAWTQSNSTTISSCTSGVYKWTFTNDGTSGSSVFTLYCLPSAWPWDWDNTSTVMNTFTVGGSLNPNKTNLFPFIIPQNGGAQRFIAVRVE